MWGSATNTEISTQSLAVEQCSQRFGGPGGPTGKLPKRPDRTGRQFLLHPVLGHFRTAGLSKDHGPHKVRDHYAVLTKGLQGTVVAADPLIRTVGICKSSFIVDHSLLHFSNNNH